jgi:hypothetical protein
MGPPLIAAAGCPWARSGRIRAVGIRARHDRVGESHCERARGQRGPGGRGSGRTDTWRGSEGRRRTATLVETLRGRGQNWLRWWESRE